VDFLSLFVLSLFEYRHTVIIIQHFLSQLYQMKKWQAISSFEKPYWVCFFNHKSVVTLLWFDVISNCAQLLTAYWGFE